MDQKRRGFTLLELLTVIGIIGLLISILLPTLSSARQSAKANACLSNLKNIGSAFSIYLNENGDMFPPHRLDHSPPNDERTYVNDFKRGFPTWQWFLPMNMPVTDPARWEWIIGQRGYFDETTPARPDYLPGTHMTNSTFACPTLDDPLYQADCLHGAYGYNYQYLGNGRNDNNPARWDNFPVPFHRIKSVSNTIVVADSRGAGDPHGRHSYTLDPPRLAVEFGATRFGPTATPHTGDSGGGDVGPGLSTEIFGYSPAEARHKRKANAVFVDGHGEAMALLEFGYQLSDGSTPGLRKDTPVPIREPNTGTYTANNRRFNGEGSDPIAEKHRPGGVP